jgi:membrane-associated phospholipid phosphatase
LRAGAGDGIWGSVTRAHLLVVAVASTLLAALGVVWFDLPLSRWVGTHEQSGVWNPLVTVCEYFIGITPWAWTALVVLCGGVLATLVVPRWHRHARAWMYVTIVYLLSRNLMAWGKTLSGRLRPHQWLKLGGDTFGHLGDGASFPSGHVVVFAGILLPLAVVWPRSRPLLLVIPFIMIARIAVLAHFASDVLAALALTALVAWACAPVLALAVTRPAPRAAPAPR